MKKADITIGDVVEDKDGRAYKVLDLSNWGRTYYREPKEMHFALGAGETVTVTVQRAGREHGRGILAVRLWGDEIGIGDFGEILQLSRIYPTGTKAADDANRAKWQAQVKDQDEALIGQVRAALGGEASTLMAKVKVYTGGGDRQQLEYTQRAALQALLSAYQIGRASA